MARFKELLFCGIALELLSAAPTVAQEAEVRETVPLERIEPIVDAFAPHEIVATPEGAHHGNEQGQLQGWALAQEAEPTVHPAPLYPMRALQRELEGYVIVEYTVTEEGTTEDVTVVESSSSLFKEAALDWRATIGMSRAP